MNPYIRSRAVAPKAAPLLLAALLIGGCAPAPTIPDEAQAARAELARLQSDPVLAPLVPQALTEAEAAVQLAEQDAANDVTAHRVYLARRQIEIARALAEARHAEQEREVLVAQREQARLDARTREADAARTDASVARMEADAARQAAAAAQEQAVSLQREIEAMHAQQTERGLVLTLGDVLFETGKAELKPGAVLDLDRLTDFLRKYPERTALIEGHTDSVGSAEYNQALSQRRADAVRGYLLRRGIETSRVTTSGLGESAPVASNDTDAGRQQNRRVQIIISDTGAGPAM
jgi:outer membrane protein OmpA-like peptidoglycan-associated protein